MGPAPPQHLLRRIHVEGWTKILVYFGTAGLGGLLLLVGLAAVIDGRFMSRKLGMVLLGLGTALTILFGEPNLLSQLLNQF